MLSFFAILLAGCIILILVMFFCAMERRIVRHTIASSAWPSGKSHVTIFFISDIHRRKLTEPFLRQIKEPLDAIIIGGDLTEKGVPIERTRDNLRALRTLNCPVFFVWGNNDYEIDQTVFGRLLAEEGIQKLKNEHCFLQEHVCLVGLDDATGHRDNMKAAMPHRLNNMPFYTILISHNPGFQWDEVLKGKVSCVLTAHTHGGQIRFGRFGPYEHGGLSVQNGFHWLQTNGYGTSLVPLRFGARPESHVLHFCRKK
ncbi:metallophosphoesterase [Aureibacillus halotolerans]|uniref:Putative MPP superfamily phosphohydrolase n=1 Tax=Aureibacillus halotolerans TaxID=1508390 RepID=A0A4R6U514_9BACI|nr:metallophosphoesterase [Aureibacillus halotolerans]TDQ41558.1 putative MPP superfamily phosphohydrolase [Aureibacillus halotolerans]